MTARSYTPDSTVDQTPLRAYTLDHLPENGHVFVHITGTRVNFDEAEDGVAEQGWIDPRWSSVVLHDSRNDVRPAFSEPVERFVNGDQFDSPANMRTALLDAIREWVAHADSSDGGTVYASDDMTWDYTTADTWRYAAHVSVKFFVPGNGHIEHPVHVDLDEINAIYRSGS